MIVKILKKCKKLNKPKKIQTTKMWNKKREAVTWNKKLSAPSLNISLMEAMWLLLHSLLRATGRIVSANYTSQHTLLDEKDIWENRLFTAHAYTLIYCLMLPGYKVAFSILGLFTGLSVHGGLPAWISLCAGRALGPATQHSQQQ